jgi:1-acyl-sn-glycerol-3-phosphate acyltransferase
LQEFKKGIGQMEHARSNVPVIPVFMHGLGKALPRDSMLLPFNVIVSVGEPLYGTDSYSEFLSKLQKAMSDLAAAEKLPRALTQICGRPPAPLLYYHRAWV